ncbi:MAG: NAD-dependent succinate-semialdehyde dehydrogenase [Actinomycetota bacterium]|nr:NAD-dependent succinate-semialdehyde dehydrogenase [Actinomycetota bacterium]MDQ2955556.1 NAD-dependent succinate-semialdehyde dehydrogenase [Actinomycetota bacterium]
MTVIEYAASLPAATPTELFIDGEWRASDEQITVLDPSSGAVLASVASASVADGRAAVDAADRALVGWRSRSPRERSDVLRRAFELMTARTEELARLISLENGKALADARGEVAYAAEFFRWYADEAVRVIGSMQEAPSGAHRILVLHQPVGVSLLVTPWNFPAAMATRKIAPALAAGCTVVLKPASDTPLTALAIAALLCEAGVPDGVVNVVPSRSSGALVGALLDDPRVRKLSFTGSTEVGRILLAAAARTVVNCSMELGGNAPFVVFADADLDVAVAGAVIAKMRNGGQACTAANRFYVERPIATAFAGRLAIEFGRLRVGPGPAPATEVGPLINDAARTKVDALVREAVLGGARVLTGGAIPDGPGSFYPPTVLTDVANGAAILAEEIFGPVAPVVAFDTEAEAIRLANDTEYGLVSYVYTGDLARGLRVGEALDSGMIGLNRGVVSEPAAPFGGTKQSGIGREGGAAGLLEFTEMKYLATSW